MGLVDAYCHCGLSKYNPLPVLERVMSKAGIERAVLVQHLGEFDNSYIQSIVADAPEKFAGVCLIDWDDRDASAQLVRQAELNVFGGVRLSIESLEFNRPLWVQAVDLGLNIVVFSFENMVKKQNMLREFLDEHSNARLILSHLGFPNLQEDPHLEAHGHVFELAKYSGVYFQVSGMHMFCKYPYRAVWPAIDRALKTFGPERMLWGSNYPVVGQDDAYLAEVQLMKDACDGVIDAVELEKIVAGTALRLWFGN